MIREEKASVVDVQRTCNKIRGLEAQLSMVRDEIEDTLEELDR